MTTDYETHIKSGRRLKSDAIHGILFTAPAITGFIALTLIPMIVSLFLSFTDYSGFNMPKFTGLANYQKMFSGEDLFFYKSLKATAYYTLLSVPASIIFSFAIALLLNSDIKFRAFFRTVFYIPTIVPAVATAVIWLWILNPDFGLVNTLLMKLGLPVSSWLFDEKSVIPTIVLIGLWGTGGTMVIFLAGLQDIPKHYYEAIDVDGGNSFHKLFNITIPLMTPTIFFNAIMAIIGSFQIFTQAYIMTNGGPNDASLFFVFYLYREAFQRSNMGYASALAWILFIIIVVFSAIILKTQNKWVYYEGEKA
ncbi:carbohydrate ABC transporter permease [Ruminiclostridium cellobioparum]|jgi:multiple sugar transport system permease protein|uniref:ABC transporter, permease protein n=1 Tax=Ruminiclostridium cellobioparum subsp. termitidis CT1112 TaxID=1195236 RepID=S0FPA7_RUMCE|nr:sugar ABC transporter permease [Ruminiclostridium cellobioparum]EMS70288.1 ABC transporter, permease protein [Ruminiclostridium cellobioparum subsp. termitidis CT1112]